MKISSLIIAIILLATLGVGIFIWEQRQEQTKQSNAIVEVDTKQDIDTSDWKIYRNEEYGFEVRYPNSWIAEEVFTAGIGIPIDCEKKSEQCHIFSIRFSQESVTKNPIVLEVYGSDMLDKSVDFYQTDIVKNTTYFPIFGSCYAQVSIFRDLLLNKGRLFHFYSLYELPGNRDSNDAEQFCSNGIPDDIFDGIVGSFFVK